MKLDMNASAVLVWLPAGEVPAIDSLDSEKVKPPPGPNPEPYLSLQDAIDYAHEADRQVHSKLPWIKRCRLD
jgi:hypothetical protein